MNKYTHSADECCGKRNIIIIIERVEWSGETLLHAGYLQMLQIHKARKGAVLQPRNLVVVQQPESITLKYFTSDRLFNASRKDISTNCFTDWCCVDPNILESHCCLKIMSCLGVIYIWKFNFLNIYLWHLEIDIFEIVYLTIKILLHRRSVAFPRV
jgi:hypothetical protein